MKYIKTTNTIYNDEGGLDTLIKLGDHFLRTFLSKCTDIIQRSPQRVKTEWIKSSFVSPVLKKPVLSHLLKWCAKVKPIRKFKCTVLRLYASLSIVLETHLLQSSEIQEHHRKVECPGCRHWGTYSLYHSLLLQLNAQAMSVAACASSQTCAVNMLCWT